MAQIRFRRIRGKIIPIKVKAATAAAGAGVGAGAGYLASRSADKKPNPTQQSVLKYTGYGLAAAAGAIGGFPVKSLKGFAKLAGVSFGVDLAANAASVASLKGIKGKKAKAQEFAKQQAVQFGLGYTTFGAGLLANKAFRRKALKLGKTIVKKVVF
jgi:hypothetical protein